jgi:hypothetical protein
MRIRPALEFGCAALVMIMATSIDGVAPRTIVTARPGGER